MAAERAGPSLHAVRLQLLGLVLHEGGGGRRGVAGGDGGLHRARVAVSHKAGGGRGSVGVLVVGSCGVLGIGLAGGGVVDVGRRDGLHRGRDHHAGLNDSLGVNIVRRESVEAKGEGQRGACYPNSCALPAPNSHASATGWCCPSKGCCWGRGGRQNTTALESGVEAAQDKAETWPHALLSTPLLPRGQISAATQAAGPQNPSPGGHSTQTPLTSPIPTLVCPNCPHQPPASYFPVPVPAAPPRIPLPGTAEGLPCCYQSPHIGAGVSITGDV